MALKSFKPVTPSLRQLVQVDRSGLWKGKPVKTLTEGLIKSGGRNNLGRITVRHRGGGHKRRYRLVDFKRRKRGMPATVERLEYDPNRTAFIALIKYQDGELAYILAPQRLAPGDMVIADEKADAQKQLEAARSDVAELKRLLEKLQQATIHFLRVLTGGGADLYQLFDSWAGALERAEYERWAQPYHRAVFSAAADVPRPRRPVRRLPG